MGGVGRGVEVRRKKTAFEMRVTAWRDEVKQGWRERERRGAECVHGQVKMYVLVWRNRFGFRRVKM